MVVVILGPPGAGKGTQAATLCRSRGLIHLSTGEMLRAAIAAGSELGQRVKAVVESGHLVSDEIVGEVVDARLGLSDARGGVLLDGFPRSRPQADALDAMLGRLGLGPLRVLLLEVPDEALVSRLSARRSCPACGPRPPAEADRCGQCGGPAVQRADDRPDVIRERLRVYHAQTAPVASHYRERRLLRAVDGTCGPEEVAERLARALDADPVV